MLGLDFVDIVMLCYGLAVDMDFGSDARDEFEDCHSECEFGRLDISSRL